MTVALLLRRNVVRQCHTASALSSGVKSREIAGAVTNRATRTSRYVEGNNSVLRQYTTSIARQASKPRSLPPKPKAKTSRNPTSSSSSSALPRPPQRATTSSSKPSPVLQDLPAESKASTDRTTSEPKSSSSVEPENAVSLVPTRPIHIQLPKALRPEDCTGGQIRLQDRVKYYFRIGKTYLGLFKSGLGNVWRNWRASRRIRARVGSGRLNDIVKYGSSKGNTNAAERREIGVSVGSGDKDVISYPEYQLCLRASQDIRRLIPFGLLFAVFGEFTPLLLPFLPVTAVPDTCRLPKQELKVIRGCLQREDELRNGLAQDFPAPQKRGKFVPQSHDAPLYGSYVAHVAGLNWPFALSSNLVKRNLDVLYRSVFIPRLRKHFDSVLCDMILIQRGGGFANLSARDMYEFGMRYGMYAQREYLREKLKALDHAQEEAEKAGLPPPDTYSSDSDKNYLGFDLDQMKRDLLPAFEQELKAVTKRIRHGDEKGVNPEDQWLLACGMFSYETEPGTPDAQRRTGAVDHLLSAREEEARAKAKSE